MEEFLASAPEHELLETDIAADSFNEAPWTGGGTREAERDEAVDPLADLRRLGDPSSLDRAAASGRSRCPRCSASRSLFCYSCHVALPSTRAAIPIVDALPIKVDVVKHPAEVEGKSTASHAKVICPSHVRILNFPEEVPDYSGNAEKAVLVYPDGEGLESAAGILDDCSRAVFVDATWSQARQVVRHQNLVNLPRVRLKCKETAFWRPQKGKSSDHLATIEAIYYFLREYHESHLQMEYRGDYDNLVFLFKYMRDKIIKVK